jgi:hypothetical protein
MINLQITVFLISIQLPSRLARRLLSLVVAGLNVLYVPVIADLKLFVNENSKNKLFLQVLSTTAYLMVSCHQLGLQLLEILGLCTQAPE